MRRLLLFVIILMSLVLPSGPIAAKDKPLSNEEKIKRIMSVASVSTEDRIFYRWQSETSGNTLLSESEYTEKRFAYFMGMEINSAHFVMGRGVYYAGDLTSSAQFIRGGGKGSLIEVHIAKGTPTLDLTSDTTMERLKNLGITKEDVRVLDPPVTVRYDPRGWWVMKRREGIRFKPFDANRISLANLVEAKEDLRGNARALEIIEPIVDARVRTEIKDPVDFLRKTPSAFHYLPADDFTSLLKNNPEFAEFYAAKVRDGVFAKLEGVKLVQLVKTLEAAGVKIDQEILLKQMNFGTRVEFVAQQIAKDRFSKAALRSIIDDPNVEKHLQHVQDSTKYQFEHIVNEGIAKNTDDIELLTKLDQHFRYGKLEADGRALVGFSKLSPEAKTALQSYTSNYVRQRPVGHSTRVDRSQVLSELLVDNYKDLGGLNNAIIEGYDIKLTPAAQKIFEPTLLSNLEKSPRNSPGIIRTFDKFTEPLSDESIEKLSRLCLSWDHTGLCSPNEALRGRTMTDLAARILESPDRYVEAWEENLKSGSFWMRKDLLKATPPTGLTFEHAQRMTTALSKATNPNEYGFHNLKGHLEHHVEEYQKLLAHAQSTVPPKNACIGFFQGLALKFSRAKKK